MNGADASRVRPHTMFRIFLAAALVVALMIAIKDGRVLRSAGLTGSCTTAGPLGADGTVTKACRPGKLQGRPDLSRQGCTGAGLAGSWEYWRCPAAVERDPRA